VSNVLTDLRVAIKATLDAAGFRTFITVPSQVTPPCAFVSPADPYLTREGATFGGEIVRHRVVVVTSAGINDTTAESLDALLLTALDALYASDDWDVDSVGSPGPIAINGSQYLAVPIELQQEIHRET
jgi:hypothetical protein